MASTQKEAQQISQDISQLRDDIGRLTRSIGNSAANSANSAREDARRLAAEGKRRVVDADALQRLEQGIADHPLQSVGIAFGIGLLIGRIARR